MKARDFLKQQLEKEVLMYYKRVIDLDKRYLMKS
jgi:hypothetical protein